MRFLPLLLALLSLFVSPAQAQEPPPALAARAWQPDYHTVRRRADLMPPRTRDATTPESLVVLGAARQGSTRLIDNFEI